MPLPKVPTLRSADGGVGFEDLFSVPETNQYYYRPTRKWWKQERVNSVLPGIPTGQMARGGKPVFIKPSDWLDQFRRIEQTTWAPGEPEIIEDKILSSNDWEDAPGKHVLNIYNPMPTLTGDAHAAAPWVDHLRLIYPTEAEEILDWMAWKVQHPDIKVNHAMFLGGREGIGKDWILQGLAAVVGASNYKTIQPTKLAGKNNAFVKSVILVVNEIHDVGDTGTINRYTLADAIKPYAAAPPPVLDCEDKYIRSHPVLNTLGLILLSNHKTDGIYLEADNRRYLVCWSTVRKEAFRKGFWIERYGWLRSEGAGHIAAFLRARDVSRFDPGAEPRQTEAFFGIVRANVDPKTEAMGDMLDELARPDAVTLAQLRNTEIGKGSEWLSNEPRTVGHKLGNCGYDAVKNAGDGRGKWSINGKQQVIYAKENLSPDERQAAADRLIKQLRGQQPLRVV
jgi:hypothetical protein